MESTDKMREDFWSTLCSISDYSVESVNKLNATFSIPDTLCRFRPVNTNTLWQLQENTQFFSTANYYDDPFDTYFKIDFQKLHDSYKLAQEMLSTGNVESIKNILSMFNIADTDGLIRSMANTSLNLPDMDQTLSNVRNVIQRSIWSICFCENPLNETMWLKYAAHHTGFALTYNFNDVGTYLCGKEDKCRQCGIINNPPVMYPVYYSEEKWLFGSLCGWQIMRRPAIAVVSGILSDAENRAGNSTVSQGSQGTGYASPTVALTSLRPSALG